YSQAIHGQYQIVARRQSIDSILAKSSTPDRLRGQLELVLALREFAATNLDLPVDGHYRTYVDLHRPYVVWSVQAAPTNSLQPKTWWYPLVGRLEYRGYFEEAQATNYAAVLRRQGYDVFVGGVEAYSTLGWFEDPVLNTFLDQPEPEVAEVLFHELAHQKLFAAGDTDFNEAFATTVGQEGARRWLAATGQTNLLARYETSLRRNRQFAQLVLSARRTLESAYGDTRDENGKVRAAAHPPGPPERVAQEKQQILDQLRSDYATLRAGWNGSAGYDEWFGPGLNNAKLNSLANYYELLPGFEELLELDAGNLDWFYGSVKLLAEMPKKERHAKLRALAAAASTP
ncbi:MAG: aminopeptidase, partial [Verrucomicrobiota bacterium]